MGDKTAISWTDATWNPVTGCSVVSPGCEHCYAESLSRRMGWSKKPWTAINAVENVVLHEDRLCLPLRWKKPRMVFVNSMSDLFHEQVPDGFIVRVLLAMLEARHHTFQVLTKRPGRMRDFFARWADLEGEGPEPRLVRGPEATRGTHPSGRGQLWAAYLESIAASHGGKPPEGAAWPTFDWMEGPRWWSRHLPHNIWLGTSVEDQRRADERIPELLNIKGPVRFLSCEPLLGPVDLMKVEPLRWLKHYDSEDPKVYINALTGHVAGPDDMLPKHIDWVIDGGESGPNFRPADPDWYRAIRDACVAAGVPYFHKQGSASSSGQDTLLDGREWHEFPDVGAA